MPKKLREDFTVTVKYKEVEDYEDRMEKVTKLILDDLHKQDKLK